MKRLSLVHTESALGWNEQQMQILTEAQGLVARGHQVRLLCPPESRIYLEARSQGVPAIGLPISKIRPLGIKVIHEWLKRNRCDVVVTHSSTDAWLAAFALLALGRPVPMVRAVHGPAPAPRNPATRWLHTRAAARVVTIPTGTKDMLAAMERTYAEVRR